MHLTSTDISIVSIVIALIAATAAVLQWWDTRRAADAAGTSADASVRSADAAKDSNLTAISTALIAERARLDERAPVILVTAEEPSGPVLRDHHDAYSKAQRVPRDRNFHQPADDELRLGRTIKITIHNDGDRTAKVIVHGQREPELGSISPAQAEHVFYIRPGASEECVMEKWAPLKTWVASIRKAESEGVLLFEQFAEVIYSDEFDNGVIDHIVVQMPLDGIEEVQGQTAAWHVPYVVGSVLQTQPTAHNLVRPRTRSYFVSKSRKEELPTPPALLTQVRTRLSTGWDVDTGQLPAAPESPEEPS